MHIFECIVKLGHMGSGKYAERAIMVRADNILQAMKRAKSLPGVEKGHQQFSGSSVMRVQMVQ